MYPTPDSANRRVSGQTRRNFAWQRPYQPRVNVGTPAIGATMNSIPRPVLLNRSFAAGAYPLQSPGS